MRRALLALTGVVAGTTLLISVKSAPGAVRLPAQVAEDEARNAAALAALAASASPRPSASASPGGLPLPLPLPGAPGSSGPTTRPPGPVPTTRTSTTRPATNPPPPAPPGSTAINGDSVYTEFGYVTVAITVSNGRMTDVIAVEMPADESRSRDLSNRAAPILRERALQTQSASFDTVSGATWTSQAYMDSLASARDKAGL